MSLEALTTGYSGQLLQPSNALDTSGAPVTDPFTPVGQAFSCTIQPASGSVQLMWQVQRGLRITHTIYTTVDLGQVPATYAVAIGARFFTIHSYNPSPDVMGSRRYFVFQVEEQADLHTWSGSR